MADENQFEPHTYWDPDFPMILHTDFRQPGSGPMNPHWHPSIELLFVLEGKLTVHIGTDQVTAAPGELVVVNSNELHYMEGEEGLTRYHCLIPNPWTYEEFGLLPENRELTRKIPCDPQISGLVNSIFREWQQKSQWFKPVVKALTLQLMATLYRCYSADERLRLEMRSHVPKQEMVKKTIRLMQENFRQELTVDTLCACVGFSKFYFCRTFKEVTGRTAVEYLNQLRCRQAREYLAAGHCTVQAAAELSGFKNQQYFCRVYKKYFGTPPSSHKGIGAGALPPQEVAQK